MPTTANGKSTGMLIDVRRPGASRQYPIETLDNLSAEDYARLFKNRIKQAQDHDRYDTLRIVAAETVPKGLRPLFGVPKDGDFKTAGGAAIVKDAGDTNMVEGFKLEYESYMLIEAIQVQGVAPSRAFNAEVAGEPTDFTPAAAGTNSSANTVLGLGKTTFLQFRLGDEVKAEGPVTKFPCGYGYSGAYGGDADEGFTQIGFGMVRPLRQTVLLKPGQNFVVELNFLRSFIVAQSVDLRVYLSGTLFKSVG